MGNWCCASCGRRLNVPTCLGVGGENLCGECFGMLLKAEALLIERSQRHGMRLAR